MNDDDAAAFLRSQISIRWHGEMDARPRHNAFDATFNCRHSSEPVEPVEPVTPPDPRFDPGYDPRTYRGQRRVILVGGPMNGTRMVLPERVDDYDLRVPYMDDGARETYLHYSSLGALYDSSYAVLRYRFENRPGDVTDSGEYVYRFQGSR